MGLARLADVAPGVECDLESDPVVTLWRAPSHLRATSSAAGMAALKEHRRIWSSGLRTSEGTTRKFYLVETRGLLICVK